MNQQARSDDAGVTIREIAEQLGRKPGTIYRQIDTLVEAGLLLEVGAGATGGRDATLYRARGRVIVLKIPDGSTAALDAMCRGRERDGALAGKELVAAIREHAEQPSTARRGGPFEAKDHASLSVIGWLDAAQTDELRAHLHAIAELYQKADRRPGTRLTATNLTIRPVRLPDGSTAEEPEL